MFVAGIGRFHTIFIKVQDQSSSINKRAQVSCAWEGPWMDLEQFHMCYFCFFFFLEKNIRLIFGTLLAFDFILLRLLKRPPLMRWRHWSYKYVMCWMPWHLRVPRILDPGVKPQRTRSVILFQYFLVVFSICISTSSYSS